MPWFRVDDDFALHPKAVAAGNAALGLWVRAGAYAAQYLTEGYVPAGMLSVLGGKPKDARALVDAGLWLVVQGGWRFHQWEERQPTKEQVEKDRADAAERQRRAREKARKAREGNTSDTAEVTGAVTRDVTRDSRSPRPGPAQTPYLLTLISRLAAPDAHGTPPPAEVVAAWQDHAGPTVDLEAEAGAYLRRFGDRPATDERGAWLGWLATARRRATDAATGRAPATPVPSTPTCPIHPDQPTGSKACPACARENVAAPNLRALITEEAS